MKDKQKTQHNIGKNIKSSYIWQIKLVQLKIYIQILKKKI